LAIHRFWIAISIPRMKLKGKNCKMEILIWQGREMSTIQKERETMKTVRTMRTVIPLLMVIWGLKMARGMARGMNGIIGRPSLVPYAHTLLYMSVA
jgi:hypothetical protein